ncbi:alpha/beta hydrolase [Undibacterium sp. TJN19]|uniref:alpha/beta hydrolase n=1 Tax=Undibacterium sp. TJN19 TaxID=3413055 RepID=UPI003BF13C54
MTEILIDPVEQALRAFTTPRRLGASGEDELALADASRHIIHFQGQQLVLWSWGKREAVTILLLHGWESRASHMTAFVPALLQAGFRVLALDAPAHGDSDGQNTNVVDYGKAVVAVANAGARHDIGQFSAVIAHSLGSAAALYAFAHGVQVTASVHLCGPSSLSRVLRRGAKLAGMDAAHISALETQMAEEIQAPLQIMDLEQLQPGMQHRSLIMHDPLDREMPVEESLALAAAWPGSHITLLADVGHRRILRAPAVIQSVADFVGHALPHNLTSIHPFAGAA